MEAVILSQSKGADVLSDKHLRLCDWNVDIMSRLLQEILASREAANVEPDAVADIIRAETEHQESGALVLDEVQDVMAMSPLDETARKRRKDPSGYQLGDDTKDQLRAYVRTIAAMYRKVPFHNWEHASHVTMSVTKLLARIVDSKENQELAYADRIISDPLAKFAFVFSAMIHDVDHTGKFERPLVSCSPADWSSHFLLLRPQEFPIPS